MRDAKKDDIVRLIIEKAKENIEFLFNFEDLGNIEFKETYGFTKEEMRQVLKERF